MFFCIPKNLAVIGRFVYLVATPPKKTQRATEVLPSKAVKTQRSERILGAQENPLRSGHRPFCGFGWAVTFKSGKNAESDGSFAFESGKNAESEVIFVRNEGASPQPT